MSKFRARRGRGFVTVASAVALALGLASAKAQGAAQAAAQAAGSEPQLDEVIVTGVTQKTVKKDATFTVNTFSSKDITELAPISTAALLQNVPGIFAEGSTAGEASNNITVRGLPVTGGYRYAPQLIDGLPWFEEPEVQFMNNDSAIRPDLMTERVEVIKGGTGGILYSNGLGATVNYVTRTGRQEYEGGYKLELADYGFIRNDLFFSGPVDENLTFALGGFYRTSDGLRDVGFTADQGGQIRGNLLYTSDDSTLKIFAQYQKVQDTTAFYQNVPFQVPAFSERGTAENPIKIDPRQVYELGVDFGSGSVMSPYNRIFTQLGEYGQREIDLSDGLTADFDMLTFKVQKEFGNRWAFDAGVRATTGSNSFNALFTGNDSTSAERFLNARYQNDVVNPAFGQALSGSCSAAKLVGFFDASSCESGGLAGISRQAFLDNFAIAKGVGAYYLDDGSRVQNDTVLNFLLPFIARSDVKSTSFDARLTKSAEFVGTHDLTFGTYASDYSVTQNFQSSLLVSSMGSPSRLVDLKAVDSAGKVVGPSLTLDGAILPGFFGYTSDITAQGQALYVLDHWEMLDRKLKVDMGLRWEERKANVVRRDRNIIAGSDQTPASIVPGSSGDTTADNEIFLPSNRRTLNDRFDAWGWSIGANYSFSNELAVYGLVSDSFRLPSLEDLNEFRVDSSRQEEQVERIMQYEAGVRFYAKSWDTQVAVFYNEFSPRQESVTFRDFTDVACSRQGTVVDINSCPERREFYRRGVQNVGVEVEFNWRPAMLDGLEFHGNFVVQDPKITDANFRTVRELRQNDVITGYEFESIGEDGRRPRRLANAMVNIRGVWDTKPYLGVPLKPYLQYTYIGDRYSESRDVDVTLYPEYFHIDGGFIWDFSEKFAFQFHVANITNELSFTEGDPLFSDLKGPNGATNRGVARPLFGRTMRAMFNYRF